MFDAQLGTKGVEDLRSKFAKAGKDWPQVAFRVAALATEHGRVYARDEVAARGLVFRGKLLNSFEASVKTEGIDRDALVVGQVLSTAGVEAAVAESGRAPGEDVSVKGLLPYVAATVGAGRFTTKGGKAKKVTRGKDAGARQDTSNAAAREVLRVAFAMATDIKRHGTKALQIFTKTGRTIQANLGGWTDRCLDDWLKESFE